jgi:predicted TIM-barrel enzyme
MKKSKETHQHEVVVGNLGCVYRGTEADDARAEFQYYSELSEMGLGRVSNEPVTWLIDGEIYVQLEV